MLNITRLLAHRLRTVFSRAVGRASRAASVQFRSDSDGLTASVRGADVSVECRVSGRQPVDTLAAPLDLLKRCEGTKDDPVILERRDHDVEARWTDAGVPQTAAFTAGEPFDLPPMPERMEANAPRLITALRDAADSADDQSTRYALACMQLRANEGRIAATDSHQLLVQEGFRLPWDGEVLVPGNPVFACRELRGEPVSIGRSDDWVTVRAGDWTVHLRIAKDARFPDIDSIIPRADGASTVLMLDPHDGEFLLDRLPKLPASAESDKPVTVDLNGHVAIRSKSDADAQATELRLTNSRLEGRPMLVQTNRDILSRAIKLGFQEVRLYDPRSTVLCCDDYRHFVWMLLNPEDAVATEATSVRIDSPASHTRTPSTHVTNTPIRNRRHRSMPAPTTATQSEPVPAANERHTTNGTSAPVHSPVEQLETLRDSLKAAVSQTNDAIRTLKRQRREDRLLKTTLSSLRQLQGIAS